MSKIRLATNKKSCHTLWAAKLTQTQHDVSTILIYYLHGCVRNLRSLPHEPSSKITRHTKLIHAVTHCPPSSERPTLCSRHVGVDGSFIEAGQGGKPMASGAACYFTHARGATGPISPAAHIITCTFGGAQTVVISPVVHTSLHAPLGGAQTVVISPVTHIITCTFGGAQTVVHSEFDSVSLGLQSLEHVPNLEIGWDHDTGVKRITSHASDWNPAPHGILNATSYDANPHFICCLFALIKRDRGQGKTRTIKHTPAHTADDNEICSDFEHDRGRAHRHLIRHQKRSPRGPHTRNRTLLKISSVTFPSAV